MARYVDGFLIPVPRKNLAAYKKMAQKASRVWIEHGALEYFECVGEDLAQKQTMTFPKQLKTKPGETVVFAWVVYKSRKQRDQVNKKIMKDPRLIEMMDPANHPFDVKRMVYGGFDVIVEAER